MHLLQGLAVRGSIDAMTADVFCVLGTFQHLKYGLPQAEENYRTAISICRELTEARGPSKESLVVEFESRQKLAQLLSETGSLDEVRTTCS
jgi:hypothetical protein